jgi:hypothetical protein
LSGTGTQPISITNTLPHNILTTNGLPFLIFSVKTFYFQKASFNQPNITFQVDVRLDDTTDGLFYWEYDVSFTVTIKNDIPIF